MPNPTVSALHHNVPLTNSSVAWVQSQDVYIADKVFPRGPVQKQSFADAHALGQALEAAVDGSFSFWDALLLATVADAGCTAILSENMHDGANLGGVTVIDPFAGQSLPADARRLLS